MQTYANMADLPHWEGIKACTSATAGDIRFELIAFWTVPTHNSAGEPWQVLLFVGVGIALTVGFEFYYTQISNRSGVLRSDASHTAVRHWPVPAASVDCDPPRRIIAWWSHWERLRRNIGPIRPTFPVAGRYDWTFARRLRKKLGQRAFVLCIGSLSRCGNHTCVRKLLTKNT